MLPSRYTGKSQSRARNGVVIALRHNMRWCCDVFEIAYSKVEVVRVAFRLDRCERERMGFAGTTGGFSIEMICVS